MEPARLPYLPLAAIALALVLCPRRAAAQSPPSDLPPVAVPPAGAPVPLPAAPAAPPGTPVKPPTAAPLPPGYGYPYGYPYPYPYPYAYSAPPAGYGYAPQYPRAEGDSSEIPPPPPRRRYDTGLFVGGVTAVMGGMVAVLTGAYLVSSGTDRIEIYCDTPPSVPCAHKNEQSRVVGGAVTMALGAAVAAAGLPMWFVGSRWVTIRHDEKRPALVPEVRIGAGSARLTWRF